LKEITPETSQNETVPLSSVLEAEGEDIENQVLSMAGLLAADAEYEISENNNDNRNLEDELDDDSLHEMHLDRSGSESQGKAMAISSDDDPIFASLPSVRRSKKKSMSRKSAKACRVKRKRTSTQEFEFSESDSETDPETCSKWVIFIFGRKLTGGAIQCSASHLLSSAQMAATCRFHSRLHIHIMTCLY
jgi:hypothetical protein